MFYQPLPDVFGIVCGRVRHREHGHLYRRQPGGHGTGVVLDQHADEALHRADDGPVQHDRTAAAVVLGHIFGVQALGHHRVVLNGAHLPGPADGVLQVILDFRAVEGALARQFLPRHVAGGQRRTQGVLGVVPRLVGTQTLVWTQGQLDRDLVKAKIPVHGHGLLVEAGDLFLHLCLGTEDVAIVLREAAHAHDAVQRSRGFVAVAGAEFGVAQRQVAIAAQAGIEELHVARAVHRFDGILALLGFGEEHVLLVVVPVAGTLPQVHVEDLRAAHFLVAVFAVAVADVLFDPLPDLPAARMPEHHARGFGLGMEQVQLLAQPAMVTLFGLFEHVQIGVLLVLFGPGGAVDALQHLVVGIAAPVGAGHLHQLEDLQLAGGGYVRPAAEVDEAAFAIEGDVFFGRDGLDDLGLVFFADREEVFCSLVTVPFLAHDFLVELCQLVHAFFDGGEVFGCEGALVGKVVVEAVFDDGADGDLGVGKQILHGVGHQVCGGMPDDVQAVGIPVGDDGDLGVVGDGTGEVDEFSVDAAGDGGLGKSGTNGGGNLGHRDSFIEAALGAVRQGDDGHVWAGGEGF